MGKKLVLCLYWKNITFGLTWWVWMTIEVCRMKYT